MLEVFKDFEIHDGDSSKLATFITELTKSLPARWKRDRKREQEVNRYSGPQFAFHAASRPGHPAAYVFLMRRDKALTITNIVPEKLGKLTRGQYNAVLEAFREISDPIAKRLDLRVQVTPDHKDISDVLTPKPLKALQSFSHAANRSTGLSHPLDRERWLKFLVLAHAERTKLDTDFLSRWLIEEQRWPEGQAMKLAIEYEFALDLLAQYDKFADQ